MKLKDTYRWKWARVSISPSKTRSLKEAASIYLREEKSKGIDLPNTITYQQLNDADYIDEFKDPYTGNYLKPSENNSYVGVTAGKITAVCLQGINRNLCENGAIPIQDLSVDRIKPNQ